METRTSRGMRRAATWVLFVGLCGGMSGIASAHIGRPGPGPGPGAFPGMDPLLRALGQLELTDDQKVAIRAALDARRSELDAARTALHDARHALEVAIYSPTYDEDAIAAAVADVCAAEGTLAVVRARTFQDVRALLTAEQQTALDNILKGLLEGIRLTGEPAAMPAYGIASPSSRL